MSASKIFTDPHWAKLRNGRWGVRILCDEPSIDLDDIETFLDLDAEDEPSYALAHMVTVTRRDGETKRVSLGDLDHTSTNFAPHGKRWEVYAVLPDWRIHEDARNHETTIWDII